MDSTNNTNNENQSEIDPTVVGLGAIVLIVGAFFAWLLRRGARSWRMSKTSRLLKTDATADALKDKDTRRTLDEILNR